MNQFYFYMKENVEYVVRPILTEGFYLTRKSRGEKPSSYSYECKACTINRVKHKRKKDKLDIYPDW